jgi:membrane protein
LKVKRFWALLNQTYTQWSEDQAPRLGAALAFYTLFSLAPLVIIGTAVFGLFLGREAAAGRITGEIRDWVGPAASDQIQQFVTASTTHSSAITATVIGTILALVGATGIFIELKSALDIIWKVKPKPNLGFIGFIKTRLASVLMLLGVGIIFILLISANTVVAVLARTIGPSLSGGPIVWQIMNNIVSMIILALLFAFMFRYVPDVEIAWGDVWVGAALTAVLFMIGRYLLEFYLSRSAVTSLYGASGSLVALLLWIYYSAQIVFFGAEFTQVYANKFGSKA